MSLVQLPIQMSPVSSTPGLFGATVPADTVVWYWAGATVVWYWAGATVVSLAGGMVGSGLEEDAGAPAVKKKKHRKMK